MIFSTDQLGRKLEFLKTPIKIISVVPSQTELLFDLGLDIEITGITKFCVHPKEWLKTKTIVGGTKNLNIDKIRKLNPDLILANKEENNKEDIALLENEFNVWISDIKNLDEAYQMIKDVSYLLCRTENGMNLIEQIRACFDKLNVLTKREISCAYLIWESPLMTVGADTFIDDMLKHCGFRNVFSEFKRYPEISYENIRQLKPEVILLSSEPYPYFDKKITEFETMFPLSKIFLVDGEFFSWFGSRLKNSTLYFTELREKIESAL